jgi:hypothetical protein
VSRDVDAWIDWARELPPHTRVWVDDAVFENLVAALVSSKPWMRLPDSPHWMIQVRAVRVLPRSRRRAA